MLGEFAPLISIVMPVKNGDKYIGQSIKSVIAQSYTNWELWVVNDHSTDSTGNIVAPYLKKDKRIRMISLIGEKTGVAYSRRRAIDSSNGEWIAFIDSDDIWSPRKLQTQMELVNYFDYNFLFTASSFIGTDGNMKKFIFHAPPYISYPEILKQDVISCSSVLVSKSLLNDCFHENSNEICDDYAAWIRILRDNADKAIGIDIPLLKYRITRTSLSFNKFESAMTRDLPVGKN